LVPLASAKSAGKFIIYKTKKFEIKEISKDSFSGVDIALFSAGGSISEKNGRHHQIRRHLKHISHPIIGDTTYGDGKHNKLFREQFNCRRLLLHARKLKFIHPVYGKEIVITAPLDDSMKQLFLEFGWLRIIQDR